MDYEDIGYWNIILCFFLVKRYKQHSIPQLRVFYIRKYIVPFHWTRQLLSILPVVWKQREGALDCYVLFFVLTECIF